MQQVKDGYYEVIGGSDTPTPLPVEVRVMGNRQIVLGKDLCWPLDHLLEDGYTFTPLVAMTPKRVAALSLVLNFEALFVFESDMVLQDAVAVLRAMLAELGQEA